MALRLIPDGLSFNFIRLTAATAVFSVALTVLSFLLIFGKGINFGTDFTGGAVVDLHLDSARFDAEKVSEQLKERGFRGVSVQFLDAGHTAFIKFSNPSEDEKETESLNFTEQSKRAINEVLGDKITYKKVEYAGPQLSSGHIQKGVLTVACALFGMFIYLWFRFNWCFGLGGLLALVHDVIVTMGFISFCNIEFNLSSVAAILTVIGYSVNDSVVIYDRIREKLKKNGSNGSEDFRSIINDSINSTLSRTILTSGSTALSAIPLSILCIGAVQDFSLVILFGIIIGTYSSIFISAPMLLSKK